MQWHYATTIIIIIKMNCPKFDFIILFVEFECAILLAISFVRLFMEFGVLMDCEMSEMTFSVHFFFPFNFDASESH